MTARGIYVLFEGIDGAGKSSQAERLAARLAREGLETVRLREPTDGAIGREIRRRASEGPPLTAEEELALFVADRKENVEKNVLPALARGAAVVQDRSFFSTIAYQGARERGPTREQVIAAHRFELPRPDVGLLIDVPVERGLARVAARGRADAFEERKFLERVRERFLELAGRGELVAIDGTRSVEDVERAVWDAVRPAVERARSRSGETKR